MKKIVFKNSLNQKLVGNLIDCGKDFIVVHCHGYGANKESKTATSLQRKLEDSNISSFTFDFSDSGESECKKEDLTVSAGIDGLNSAIQYLKNLGFHKFALSGSSFGGNVVLNYIVNDKTIIAAVLKAPVSDWESINVSRDDELSTSKFLDDAKKYTIYSKAKNIICPVLIFHGDIDEIVPIEQSKKTCSLISRCHLNIVKGSNHKLADHIDDLTSEATKFFKENKK